MIAFIEKRKIALQRWVKVNNLKKEWGRKRLRRLLITVTDESMAMAKEVLNTLKLNRAEGREKKLKQCRRTINTDTLFMSTFFHIWRFNETSDKNQKQLALQNTLETKTKSLTKIDSLSSKVIGLNLKDII